MLLFIKHNHCHHHSFGIFVVIAMLYTSIGKLLVSLEANIIGYWIFGAFLGVILTLMKILNEKIVYGSA